jgi:lipoprotein-releasing system ATP-binding protein
MLEAQNVTKVYATAAEELRVHDGLDLQVPAGGTVAVTGPSGSGKTTLLNLLGALDRPTSGSIQIGGREVTGMNPAEACAFRNRALGFVFQQHHLLPQLNVLENVLVPRLAGDWEEAAADTRQRALELLESTGLGARLGHMPWQLSGGEKLRVALARALVNRPELLLADEPTGSLDEEATDMVAELLLDLNRRQGVTMVVVTHNPRLARRLGRTLRLDHGKLGEVGE